MSHTTLATGLTLLAIVSTHSPGSTALAGQSRDTFSATGIAGDRAEGASIALTFTIDRYTTDAEQAAVMRALKDGTSALQALLKALPDVGTISVQGTLTSLKYAYKPPRNGGQTITLMTSEPLAYAGAGQHKPTDAYGLAVARLDFSTPG